MTTLDEELRSLKMTEDFLLALANRSAHYAGGPFERVPKRVKLCAAMLLRHFPTKGRIGRCWARPDSTS